VDEMEDDNDEQWLGEGEGTETEEAEPGFDQETLDDDDGDAENINQEEDIPSMVSESASLASESEQNSTIKRRLRAERRRLLATRKKEYDKQVTIEKLLKRSPTAKASSTSPSKLKHGTVKPQQPMITYKITKELNTVTFPEGFQHDILKKRKDIVEAQEAAKPVKCGVEGCMQLKRYTCSKTNVQLCSLECYRKNLARYVWSTKFAGSLG